MPREAPIKKKTRVYYTGLVPFTGEHLQREIRGRGWAMKMGVRPDKCRHKSKGANKDNNFAEAEIVICASNIYRAEAALALFMDCLRLLIGPSIWDVELKPIPEDDQEREESRVMFGPGSTMLSTIGFDVAAMLAKRASAKRRFAYAIALHAISCHNHANHPVDLDPAEYPYRARSETYRDHARFAQAINAAYAAIEQLKLSPEDKSFENHAWIPEKRQALETKLKRAGVDLTETLM